MEGKRKISYRKVLQAATTFVVTVGCVVAMVSASRIEDKKYLDKISVHIKNSKKYHFVEEKEIIDEAITKRHLDIMHTPIGKLDLQGIELALRTDPWVAEAQVYLDNNNNLNINITQRLPVARLFTQDGNSCYMDRTMSIMPLSPNFVYYTSVVTNVPVIREDTATVALKKQLLSLINTIQRDTFWNTQVTQIVVDSIGCFEMIPVLGNQRILVGDTSRLREKLDNLFAFYKNVLNRIGWDKYEVLDLRYRNQVIGKPSLPYHGPKDYAVANMNWISSIVETEAKNEDIDTTHNADDKPLALTPATQAADHTTPTDKKDKDIHKEEKKKTEKGKDEKKRTPEKEKKKPDKHEKPEQEKKGKKPPG